MKPAVAVALGGLVVTLARGPAAPSLSVGAPASDRTLAAWQSKFREQPATELVHVNLVAGETARVKLTLAPGVAPR